MSSVIEYKECTNGCGNKEMTSDYHYKSEELYEFCDVCAYYHTIIIKNRLKDGNYPDDWTPEYDEVDGIADYVIKIFEKDEIGFFSTCVKKEQLKAILKDLKEDIMVYKFAITFIKEGYYQTQIFKK